MTPPNNNEAVDCSSDKPTARPKPTQIVSLIRPRNLGDLLLPSRTIESLQHMADKDSMVNMLFYGEPGVGKSCAAQILIGTLHSGFVRGMEVDGTSERDMVSMDQYTSSVSFTGLRSLCFIDQADHIARPDQAALLKIIDSRTKYCCFILAVNDTKKLIPALRSRFLDICFNVASHDQDNAKNKLIARYHDVLTGCGITFDRNRLSDLINTHFPDLRSIANHVDFEFS